MLQLEKGDRLALVPLDEIPKVLPRNAFGVWGDQSIEQCLNEESGCLAILAS